MTAFRFAFLALIMGASLSTSVFAQEKMSKGEEAALSVIEQLKPAERKKINAPTEETLKLSRELHKYWDIEGNLETFLDEREQLYPKAQQEPARKIMEVLLNADDMRELSIHLAARVYTEKELNAMVSYFKQDAAKTAEEKSVLFSGLVNRGTESLAGKKAADIIQKTNN